MTGLQLAKNWKILLLGPSAGMAASLRTLFAQEVPAAQVFEVRSYPDSGALRNLFSGPAISICLLDASSSRQDALALLREMQQIAPRLAVIVLLEADDADLMMACLRQGAAEFLIHPFEPAQIGEVFARVAQARPELQAGASNARVIAVVPAKGACGASTIAVNLAFQRKRLNAKRLLLADLDPLSGTVSFLLKAKQGYSFLDALSRSASLDADVWKGLISTADGFDVLYGPEILMEGIYDLPDPSALINFARILYDVVIVDAASAYGAWNTRLALLADEVVLVVAADSSAVPAAQRSITALRGNHVPDRSIKIVLNRLSKESPVDPASIEQALGCRVFATLSNDPEGIQQALIDGRPAASGSAFAKGLVALAEALSGSPEPIVGKPAKTGGFGGLLGLFGNKR